MTSLEQTTFSANLYTDVVLAQLKATFKPAVVTPKTTIEEVMYAAGQQSVIVHVESKLITMRASGN